MANAKTIDALLFDLGGVLIEIDFDRALRIWATSAGAPFAALKSRFTFDEPYMRHERGEIDGRAYFASLRDTLGVDLTDEQLAEGWNSIFVRELPNIRDHLSRLGRRYPLHVFSNSNPTHRAVWEAGYPEVLRHFRRIFVSSDLGVRKPEPEAFHRVADEIGVPIGRILFFDDTEENVTGARAVGMQAVRVRSVADIEQAAWELGIPTPG
jgi:putative hydrolase of the HAD superfamily